MREALDHGASGVSGGLVHEVAARVCVDDRPLRRGARSHLADARRLLRRAAGSMWIAPIYGRVVELADRDGKIADVRRAVAEAQELMRGAEEYAFYARELYLSALRAEADAAGRARAARDAEAEEEALRSGHALAARMRQLAESSGAGGNAPPQVVADLARVDAEEARLEGRASEELWRLSASANQALGNLVGVAYARLREAEALLDSHGDAAQALRDAHSIASESGAIALREDCEELARRARIRLGDEEPAVPSPADDPFGLTRARARGARARRGGPHQPPDRRAAVHEREDRERACVAHPRQARGEHSRRGGLGGAQARPRRAALRGNQRRIADVRGLP